MNENFKLSVCVCEWVRAQSVGVLVYNFVCLHVSGSKLWSMSAVFNCTPYLLHLKSLSPFFCSVWFFALLPDGGVCSHCWFFFFFFFFCLDRVYKVDWVITDNRLQSNLGWPLKPASFCSFSTKMHTSSGQPSQWVLFFFFFFFFLLLLFLLLPCFPFFLFVLLYLPSFLSSFFRRLFQELLSRQIHTAMPFILVPEFTREELV